MIFYSFIEISIIYIENMVLFEVNKLKKYPQNKKKHHKWIDKTLSTTVI